MKKQEKSRFWKVLLRWLKIPAVGTVLLCGVILSIILWLRAAGLLQRLEFRVYDSFLEARMRTHLNDPPDPDIVLVGMTEKDLQDYGYPFPDDKLLLILQKLNALNPCVIGLDLYRDLPEPRIRKGTKDEQEDRRRYEEFGAALKAMEKLYVIERVGYFAAPEPLRGTEQVTANNLLNDDDGIFRRVPLFVRLLDEVTMIPSLSLQLAMAYLDSKGIPVEMVKEPVPQTLTDYLKVGWNAMLPAKSGARFTLEEDEILKLGNVKIPRIRPSSGAYTNLRFYDYTYLNNYRKPVNFRKMDKSVAKDPLGQYAIDTPHDFSFGDVLTGKVKPEEIEGKVIYMATVMQSIKDSNPTPVHENLRGVQAHIMATRQLIDAGEKGIPTVAWWPDWGEVLWIAACTLAGGLLALWNRSPWRVGTGIFILGGGIYLFAWYSFASGTWILAAMPLMGASLATAVVISYLVAIERADRKVVQSLFAKHVSKDVAETIYKNRDQFMEGGKLVPRSIIGTVIFTDLAGFSTASEKLTAEQTMRWLNSYMDVMVEVVEKHTGTVNKFIGDAIMAVFGAPLGSQTEEGIAKDATEAIQCALEMRGKVSVLNERWKVTDPDFPPVAMRVGVFTGPLMDGNLGSANRLEWTVIGDTVNRANRLESAGKEIKDQLTEEEILCPILIGPETFARVGHLFETAPVPDMALKGISERVTVYRVLSEKAPNAKTISA